jgi:hypothetical protein
LKQSGYEWAETRDRKLKDLGFTKCSEDENIYIKRSLDYGLLIIAIYVDDMLVLSTSQEGIEDLYNNLSNDFKVRNLGPVQKFLSLDVYRPDPLGEITLTMTTYIAHMLKKFNMQDCNPANAPSLKSVSLHKRRANEEKADETLYRSMIGSLQHAAVTLRFDIAFQVSKLAQYLHEPSTIHLSAAKHVFRYLKGHANYGVTYTSSRLPLTTFPLVYADASFANDADDHKSTGGWLAFFNGGVISHSSKKQTIVAQSTMEAEYAALFEGSREALFQCKLWNSLNDITGEYIPIIYTDSQAAYDHVKNNVRHARTKHFDLKLSFVRDAYASGKLNIVKIAGIYQLADILTKPLPAPAHHAILEKLNFRPLGLRNSNNIVPATR